MKVRQVIEAGKAKSCNLPYYGGSDLEFIVEGGEVTVCLTEDIMKSLHNQLGNRLTKIAEERLADAKELVETVDE